MHAFGLRYVRERNDGLFRPVTYLVFKLVDELALNWIVSLASCGIIYGGCRLSGSFVYFWLMLTSTLSNGVGEYRNYVSLRPSGAQFFQNPWR